MAKSFAKQLYNSKEWEQVRNYVFIRDKGLCQKCGRPAAEVHHIVSLNPNNVYDNNISLNQENLISVCKECHFGIHKLERLEKLRQFNKRKYKHILNKDGYYWDENGYVQPMRVYIVYGSPRAGKTTYVREHKEEGDLVVDLDAILAALAGSDERKVKNNLLGLAINTREFLFQQIEDRARNVDCKNCWVIGCLPLLKERKELAQRLRAELVYIDTDQETCVERAVQGNLYNDVEYSEWVVRQWWGKYQK